MRPSSRRGPDTEARLKQRHADVLSPALGVAFCQRRVSTYTPEMASLPVIAREFANRMRERFGERVADIRVFGSYARGEAHEESDLDVLVLVRDLDRVEKLAAMDDAAEVAMGTGLTLNALVMSAAEHERLLSLESRLVLDIAAEGVSV